MNHDNSFGGFVSAGDLGGGTPSPNRPPVPNPPPAYPNPPAPPRPNPNAYPGPNPNAYPGPNPPVPPRPNPPVPPRPNPPVPPRPNPPVPPRPNPAVHPGHGSVPPPPPPRPAPPSKTAPTNRISVGRELRLLLRQGLLVLVGDKRNLIISLLFPFIAAAITVWIAGENMFVTYEATKSACFILVCASIWGGLFNSIQSLVKERDNIKRDYVSGALRIECYMGSRALIQLVLCLVQSLVLTMSIPGVEMVHGNNPPSEGLLGLPVLAEFYIALFLVMYASDALGLMISSFVKKEELASKLAPYILIAQLLFSGVLFKLEGAANAFSGIMISRWGMEALGSICDLNATNTLVYQSFADSKKYDWVAVCTEERCCGILPSLQFPEPSDAYEATSEHFVLVLLIMVAFIVVPLVLGDLLLHRVKKDGRD